MGLPVEYKSQWDLALMERANEIIDLLLRAKRLGYRVVSDEPRLRELVKLLEEMGLQK